MARRLVIRDSDMVKAARDLVNWKQLSPFLGLTEAEDRKIERSCESYGQQKLAMLKKWREKKGAGATYGALIHALTEAYDRRVSDYVLTLAENSSNELPSAPAADTGSGGVINYHR